MKEDVKRYNKQARNQHTETQGKIVDCCVPTRKCIAYLIASQHKIISHKGIQLIFLYVRVVL